MPRQARLELPGIPLHVTQRGVNRCATFVDDEDRDHYYQLLCGATREHGIAVHAYVFVGNHVHLLLTSTSPQRDALSRSMRNVGQCYVQAFNRRHRRSGTLWQGRFKSCLVDSERYLLTVYRYIELDPVRAAMVERPDHYRWSSVHANFLLASDALVTPHPAYLALDEIPQFVRKPTVSGCAKVSARMSFNAFAHTFRRSARWGIRPFRPSSSGLLGGQSLLARRADRASQSVG